MTTVAGYTHDTQSQTVATLTLYTGRSTEQWRLRIICARHESRTGGEMEGSKGCCETAAALVLGAKGHLQVQTYTTNSKLETSANRITRKY